MYLLFPFAFCHTVCCAEHTYPLICVCTQACHVSAAPLELHVQQSCPSAVYASPGERIVIFHTHTHTVINTIMVTHIHTHKHTSTHTHTHMKVVQVLCMLLQVRGRLCAVCAHTGTHMHTHKYTHTHTCTHMHTHIHAQVPEADEVFAAYQLAESSIQQFMHNTHSEWFTLTDDPGLQRELHANLLAVEKAAGGYVCASFVCEWGHVYMCLLCMCLHVYVYLLCVFCMCTCVPCVCVSLVCVFVCMCACCLLCVRTAHVAPISVCQACVCVCMCVYVRVCLPPSTTPPLVNNTLLFVRFVCRWCAEYELPQRPSRYGPGEMHTHAPPPPHTHIHTHAHTPTHKYSYAQTQSHTYTIGAHPCLADSCIGLEFTGSHTPSCLGESSIGLIKPHRHALTHTGRHTQTHTRTHAHTHTRTFHLHSGIHRRCTTGSVCAWPSPCPLWRSTLSATSTVCCVTTSSWCVYVYVYVYV